MRYELEIATEDDRAWLDELRRVAYHQLMTETFGAWDETRHNRHCQECWNQGAIQIVSINGNKIGMIQLTESPDVIELSEIQIHPDYQGRQIGQRLMIDVISRAREAQKKLTLSVALKNRRALKFYQGLGFRTVGRSDSHFQMRFSGHTTEGSSDA